MPKFLALILFLVLAWPNPAPAQQPPGPAATPADYILLTIILKHDQSKTWRRSTGCRMNPASGPSFPRKGSWWSPGISPWAWGIS